MKASKTRFKRLPDAPQVLPTTCLNCGDPTGYQPAEVHQSVDFRNEKFKVTYRHMACSACGDAILDDAQFAARISLVVTAYQKRHRLLTAEELIRKRKALGYNSQRSFLRAAPELSEATLKRIEAGMHAQDVSTDALIRKVLTDLNKVQIMNLLNEPLEPPVESSNVQFPSKPQSLLDPLAAAACVTFAAGTILLSPGNRIANRDYETAYNEVRIESC